MKGRSPALARAFVVTAVGTLAACSSVHVQSTHDPTVDFSRLHTYAWLRPADDQDGAKTYGWRVREAVERDLRPKGLTPVQGGEPDVLLNYSVQIRASAERRGVSQTYGDATGWGPPGAADPYTSERREGTLVLTMLDPATRRQIWRASAETRLAPDPTPDQLTKQVNDVVERMLKGFPP
jgi:hypothetical protein